MEFHGRKYWQHRTAAAEEIAENKEKQLDEIRKSYTRAMEIIDAREQRIVELTAQLAERESRIIELQDTLDVLHKLHADPKAIDKAAQWDAMLDYGGKPKEVVND